MTTFKKELIEQYIAEHGISRTEFCKRCGITNSALNKFYSNKLKKVLPVLKISRVLKVKYSDLISEE